MSVHSTRSSEWTKHLFVGLLLCVELLPLYMMWQISLKTNGTFLANPWLPPSPTEWELGNYAYAARTVLPFVLNTLVVALAGSVLSLACALCGAYFFARYRMPFSGILWSACLILMLLPSVANIVPLFALLKEMSLLNTLYALVAVGVAASQAFNLYVLRTFIEEIPKDLFEAAEMDGAGHLRQLFHIVVPMSQSILGTLGILAFLQKWNEFLLPLIVLRDHEKFTIGVGLIYMDGQFVKQWGQIMAGYFLAALPLIALFCLTMRLFVRSLSQGAIKG